jgi:hypothetical protein
VLCESHLLLQKMIITVTTAVTAMTICMWATTYSDGPLARTDLNSY